MINIFFISCFFYFYFVEGYLPTGPSYLDHKISGVQRSSSASESFNSLLPQHQQHPVTGSTQSSLNPNDSREFPYYLLLLKTTTLYVLCIYVYIAQ